MAGATGTKAKPPLAEVVCTKVDSWEATVEITEEVEIVEYVGDKKLVRKEFAPHKCVRTVHSCTLEKTKSYPEVSLTIVSLSSLPYEQGKSYTVRLEPAA